MPNYPMFGNLDSIFGGRRSGFKRLIAPTSLFLLCSTILLWYFVVADYSTAVETWEELPSDALAPRLRPQQLLSQSPVSGQNLYDIPQYIHQSWMNDDLPSKMSRWSQTCRSLHRHWQWVLWTDEDNAKMVETFFPWFLDTYRALPAEINRADASRNMYMYMFGGIYADLDTECLRPFDGLFNEHGVKLRDQDILEVASGIQASTTGTHVAFFGRMGFDGTDDTLQHTIPNAWMAATPGHPLFLLVLERLKDSVAASKSSKIQELAEALTGPVALYRAIEEYNFMVDNGSSFSVHFKDNPSYRLFIRPSSDVRVQVLPPQNIYPYAWNNQGIPWRSWCSASSGSFDSKKCKAQVTTHETYAITYWSHSWSVDTQKDHDDHNLDRLNDHKAIRKRSTV